MKRVISVAIVSGLLAGLAACGGEGGDGNASGAPELDTVNSGELTVCADVSFPPMEYFEDGSDDPTGFDIEGARAVAEELGLEAKFENLNFDGLLPALGAGRCDVVWSGLYVSEERLAQFDAVPYLKSGYGVLVPAGNPDGVATVEDLAGLTVAVGSGTATMKELERINQDLEAQGLEQMELSLYQKLTEEVAAVKSGKADAVVEIDISLAAAAASDETSLEIVPDVFPAESQLGVYLKQDSSLKADLEEALAIVDGNGTLADLASQFGLSPSLVIVGESAS